MSELSLFLANIRKEKGFTQQKMADWLGIPQRTWANYETGRSEPSLKLIIKLQNYGYDVPCFKSAKKEVLGSISKETESSKAKFAHVCEFENKETESSKAKFADACEFENVDENIEQQCTEITAKQTFDVFRFKHGTTVTLAAKETDFDALVLLPVFTQTAAAGRGQPESQLQEIDRYIPIVLEMLGGANPKNCGIVRVVGDSMTDMNLFNGDFVVFDKTQTEGDGVYVISIGADVRVKHLEYRPIEQKIVISSENAKRYPNPEIISYEQAENMLRVHGKVISWLHRNPY